MAEAEREVTGWLAYLVENGRYDWEWVEPLQWNTWPTVPFQIDDCSIRGVPNGIRLCFPLVRVPPRLSPHPQVSARAGHCR